MKKLYKRKNSSAKHDSTQSKSHLQQRIHDVNHSKIESLQEKKASRLHQETHKNSSAPLLYSTIPSLRYLDRQHRKEEGKSSQCQRKSVSASKQPTALSRGYRPSSVRKLRFQSSSNIDSVNITDGFSRVGAEARKCRNSSELEYRS